jgi:hypothetical protein
MGVRVGVGVSVGVAGVPAKVAVGVPGVNVITDVIVGVFVIVGVGVTPVQISFRRAMVVNGLRV